MTSSPNFNSSQSATCRRYHSRKRVPLGLRLYHAADDGLNLSLDLSAAFDAILSQAPLSPLWCHGSAYINRDGIDKSRLTGDILRILVSGDLATLALLDLSAAYDSVDHGGMLRRLRGSYGLLFRLLYKV